MYKSTRSYIFLFTCTVLLLIYNLFCVISGSFLYQRMQIIIDVLDNHQYWSESTHEMNSNLSAVKRMCISTNNNSALLNIMISILCKVCRMHHLHSLSYFFITLLNSQFRSWHSTFAQNKCGMNNICTKQKLRNKRTYSKNILNTILIHFEKLFK